MAKKKKNKKGFNFMSESSGNEYIVNGCGFMGGAITVLGGAIVIVVLFKILEFLL